MTQYRNIDSDKNLPYYSLVLYCDEEAPLLFFILPVPFIISPSSFPLSLSFLFCLFIALSLFLSMLNYSTVKAEHSPVE